MIIVLIFIALIVIVISKLSEGNTISRKVNNISDQDMKNEKMFKTLRKLNK